MDDGTSFTPGLNGTTTTVDVLQSECGRCRFGSTHDRGVLIASRYHAGSDFLIGLAITIAASVLNAAGLNLTKLDLNRNSLLSPDQRKRDWLRPLWVLGLLMYIISQLVGSTLALQYRALYAIQTIGDLTFCTVRAEYVAPLGSASLIFNFVRLRGYCML